MDGAIFALVALNHIADSLSDFYAERGFTRIGTERRLVMKASTVNRLVDGLIQTLGTEIRQTGNDIAGPRR